MAHSYLNLYYHLIWHTKKNLPYLQGDVKRFVFNHIKRTCTKYSVKLVELNSIENHIHLLINPRKWISIPDFVWEIKGKSSYDIKKMPNLNLNWQDGYAVFTVSEQEVEKLKKYIKNQEKNHLFLKIKLAPGYSPGLDMSFH